MKFHSPYQFINLKPVTANISYENPAKLKDVTNPFVRHDYWAKDSLSGVIHCKLTTQSPLVLGGQQVPGTTDKPGTVQPYRHPDGSLAIPANSLRGMISSLAEAISNSSLRVLASEEDSTYTVRKAVRGRNRDRVLKNIGLLKYDPQEKQYYLYKLPSPCSIYSYPIFTRNDYNSDKARKLREFIVNKPNARFINQHQTYHQNNNPEIIYADTDNGIIGSLSNERNSNCQKAGILYIRGKHFDSKQKELFIPVPLNEDKNSIDLAQLERLTVSSELLEQLEIQLLRYKDKNNPYNALPKGYHGNWDDENPKIIHSGDLIYYHEQGNGQNAEITELSYSQIWRRTVNGNLHTAISRQADKDALPWNSDRKCLTPAEAIFGVVEDMPNAKSESRNLASRVQFSDAHLAEGQTIKLLDKVILKILDSPKPPSPAMYFHSSDGQTKITKQSLDLSEASNHQANGRKFYTPHTRKLADYSERHLNRENWESKYTDDNPPTGGDGKINWKQYLTVSPIPEDTLFEFDIHFENLGAAELTLLQKSLDPYAGDEKRQGYIHRLGLGKPLGLGHINLEIDDIKIIERAKRYDTSSLLKQERFHPYSSDKMNTDFINQITLDELKTLFNPDNIKLPVCYPFSAPDGQQAGEEGEGFKWFVYNEKSPYADQQTLETKDKETISTLHNFADD